MTIEIGTQLGVYEIVGPLGAGGMGEVYRATDSKLGREVALKVLPDVMARDPQRVARFAREAKLLATLNHPNIAGIYDFGEADGTHFLVMELVEGVALDDRFNRGAMPIEEALPLFAQIAEALENAHEQGIVHRDLKPANIKVTDDGLVKVLDFGLAKALESDASNSALEATQSHGSDPSVVTGEGRVLGTPAYMAPEQASGKPLDKRADIWAFGCCLYEALSGKRPFAGSNATELLADIIKGEPGWDALPKETPGRVRILLWRCLQKDTRRRLRDIGDARMELDGSESDSSGAFSLPGPTASKKSESSARLVIVALLALLVGIGVGLALRSGSDPSPPEPISAAPLPLIRTTMALTPDAPYSDLGYAAISPDGRTIVYCAEVGDGTQLMVRGMDELEARLIPGTEGAQDPFFSPSGQWIGFDNVTGLKKVLLQGGPVQTIHQGIVGKAAWVNDETIIFSTQAGFGEALYSISASGGEVKAITPPDSGGYGRPCVLPGGRGAVFGLYPPNTADAEPELTVFSMESMEVRSLSLPGYFPRYAESGHLVYAQGQSLWAVPFDLESLETRGSPRPVLENVAANQSSGRGAFDFSDGGTLIYASEDGSGLEDRLVWVDRLGETELLDLPAGPYTAPKLSSDGGRLAFSEGSTGSAEIMIFDLENPRSPVPLTDKRSIHRTGIQAKWERPGDRRLVIGSRMRSGLFGLSLMPTDLSSMESVPLFEAANFVLPWAWTPDGGEIIGSQLSPDMGVDIVAISVEEGKLRFLVNSRYEESKPSVSADGKWIAYRSDRSGTHEIWVRPYPNPESAPPLFISTAGGDEPIFSPDTPELFYFQGASLMSVRVPGGDEPTWSVPEKLFDLPFKRRTNPFTSSYDAAPGGERFITIKVETGDRGILRTEFIVVQNWFEELKRLAPPDKEASK